MTEFELERLKLVNQDQAQKIQEQGIQIQAGFKYVQDCETQIKALKNTELQQARELELMKQQVGIF